MIFSENWLPLFRIMLRYRGPAATRKAIMLRFAHAAALRLQALNDPQGPYSGETF